MAARHVPYMLSSAEVGCRGSNGGSPVQSTDTLPTWPPFVCSVRFRIISETSQLLHCHSTTRSNEDEFNLPPWTVNKWSHRTALALSLNNQDQWRQMHSPPWTVRWPWSPVAVRFSPGRRSVVPRCRWTGVLPPEGWYPSPPASGSGQTPFPSCTSSPSQSAKM